MSINGRKFLIRWIRATWIGWLLGISMIIVLALIGDVIGIGGTQIIVGTGMGMGIGLMQGRVLGSLINKSAPWLWSCIIGLAIPFLLIDISKILGINIPYSLQLAVALGGLIAGLWQARILRSHFHKTWSWVAMSAMGWVLAAGTAAGADYLFQSRMFHGLWGALAFLGVIAVGGLILGLVTAIPLAWMLRYKPVT